VPIKLDENVMQKSAENRDRTAFQQTGALWFNMVRSERKKDENIFNGTICPCL
jgi:hypothetical protein